MKTPDHGPGPLLVEHLQERVDDAQELDMSLLRRLVPFLRPHFFTIGIALVLMPVASVASLAQPLLVKASIDASIVARSREALGVAVALFAVAVTVEFLSRFAQTYLMQLGGQRATAELRRHVFARIQELPVGYFDRTPVGRVVTRVTNDIDNLTELFASGAVTAIADVVTLFGIVGFMLALDWRLSLVAFTALPPLAWLVNVFRRRARGAFRGIRVRIAQLNAYLAEQVQGITTVQAYAREADCEAEYRWVNAQHRDANFAAIRYDALLYSVVESIAAACIGLVLFYAGVRVGLVENELAAAAYVGTVVAFYGYIERFFVPIRDLATKYTIIQSSLAAAERIFLLLDRPERDAPPGPAPAGEGDPELAVELSGVTFAYREGHPVLHDVSFRVARGEKIAFVGATGSGKTTVTSLLLRLYELQEGAIRVEGTDVRALDRHALRGRFAVVPQDVFLFSGTAISNVALGETPPDRARVERCLERVGLLERLSARGGLETRVDERGQNFSAGERQLFALARALYRDAPIVVLDEATANVDSETEAVVQHAIEEVLRDRSAIVIAHRLSTIRRVDRIVVFHHGRIVEEGDHEALLAQNGVYAKLYRLQMRSETRADVGRPRAAAGAAITE